MNHLIVAIGGTGQMVLHYYAVAYLLGQVAEPFRAVVVDTDEPIASLRYLSGFFRVIRLGLNEEEARRVPDLEMVKIEVKEGSQIYEVLTGSPLPDQAGFHNPIMAYYGRDALRQDANKGLFALPALVSVAACREAVGRLGLLHVRDDTNIALAGSVIGGTGGGLLVPTLSTLQERTKGLGRVSFRAVLFGEYFVPDPGKGVHARFGSNKRLVLRILGEAAAKLYRYALVDESGAAERNPDAEKRSDHLKLPPSESPYWKGVAALRHLLRETTAEARQWPDNEVPAAECVREFSQPNVSQALSHRLPVVNTLIRKNVVERFGSDPAAVRIWGRDLEAFLNVYWKAAATGLGGFDRTAGFLADVQAGLRQEWEGLGGYGLSKVFPHADSPLVPVGRMRRIHWDAPARAPNAESFRNREQARRIAAASLLLHALRAGG